MFYPFLMMFVLQAATAGPPPTPGAELPTRPPIIKYTQEGEIPLSEILGSGLGAVGKSIHNNRELSGLLIQAEKGQLGKKLGNLHHAGPAFLVRGDDRAALKRVIATLEGWGQIQHSFFETDELYLIVVAYGGTSFRFQPEKIEYQNKRIVVTWHFDNHFGEGAAYSMFMMIPLGHLQKGEYDVEMRRNTARFDADWWVSKSTSFQVLPKEEVKRQSLPADFSPVFEPRFPAPFQSK